MDTSWRILNTLHNYHARHQKNPGIPSKFRGHQSTNQNNMKNIFRLLSVLFNESNCLMLSSRRNNCDKKSYSDDNDLNNCAKLFKVSKFFLYLILTPDLKQASVTDFANQQIHRGFILHGVVIVPQLFDIKQI
jgi:hypothetical protein